MDDGERSDESCCWCAHDSGQEIGGQFFCGAVLNVFVVTGVGLGAPLHGAAQVVACVAAAVFTFVLVSWSCHGCPCGSGVRCVHLEEPLPAPGPAPAVNDEEVAPPGDDRVVRFGWQSGAPRPLPPPSPRPIAGVDAARSGVSGARRRSGNFIGYSLVHSGSGHLRVAFPPRNVSRAPPPAAPEAWVSAPALQLRNVIVARDASAPPPPAREAAVHQFRNYNGQEASAPPAPPPAPSPLPPPPLPPMPPPMPVPLLQSMGNAALEWAGSALRAIASAAHDAQAAAARALPWLITPPPELPPRAGSTLAAVVAEQQQALAVALALTRRRALELQSQSLEAQRLPPTQQSQKQAEALTLELARVRQRERELEQRERERERRERELESRLESTESELERAAAQARSQEQSLERARSRETALGAQVEDLRAARACVVCMDAEKDTVLRPCMHECVCAACARSLATCPVCRARIAKRDKVFV